MMQRDMQVSRRHPVTFYQSAEEERQRCNASESGSRSAQHSLDIFKVTAVVDLTLPPSVCVVRLHH